MSSFRDAIAGAFASIDSAAAVEAIYRRDNAWVSITPTPGASTFRVDDGYGGIMKTRSRDYLISACALVLSGAQATPKRGDVIDEIVGNKIHRHEVLRPDGGEEVWRYCDAGRSRIRVHTKLKEVLPR
jgi:hypothetical protein